ncbi:MAG: hypothetical protein D6798_08295 [Deltaproteobacteria bacterium]|nr:MAG: hypothetical protein D6798_08295 [Deltaproteobacteria bacterium]
MSTRRRPYAFLGRHLTGIDLAEQVDRHAGLRGLRAALAERLGEAAAEEEAESVLPQALDDLGSELVTEISRDIDALLRTWGRLADDYRSASDRGEMGRVAQQLADLPGRLEERVRMVPNAGGLISEAIPTSLVARLRYPVAAGRVQPEDLARLGERLKAALPAAVARELVRLDDLDALVQHAVQPLLRGLEVLPGGLLANPRSGGPPEAEVDWEAIAAGGLQEELSGGVLRFERAWPPQAPPTPDHLPQAVEDVAVSPDGRVAVWGRWEPWVHRLDGSGIGRRLGEQDARSWWRHCIAAAISPDGRQAATGGAGITIWDLEKGRAVLDLAEGQTQELHALSYSPCGRTLAAVGASGLLTLFDAATGQTRWSLRLEDPAQAVAFSPDGRLLYAGGWTGAVSVHAAADGSRRAVFDDIGGCINDIAVDGCGRWVVTAGGCACPPGTPLSPGDVGLRIFEARSGAVVGDILGHTHPVARVDIVGDRLVSISDDGTLRAWSLPGGTLVGLVDLERVGDQPTALAVGPGDRVFVGLRSGAVATWRLG